MVFAGQETRFGIPELVELLFVRVQGRLVGVSTLTSRLFARFFIVAYCSVVGDHCFESFPFGSVFLLLWVGPGSPGKVLFGQYVQTLAAER